MADDMRTLGYICPKCGAQVMGARSVFALEASDAEIECSCGGSVLRTNYDGQNYHILVPCGVCGQTHEAVCPPERMLHAATALSCPDSKQFCCFIGDEGTVEHHLREASIAISKEKAQENSGEAEAFTDNVIMYEFLSELKDIAARPNGIRNGPEARSYSFTPFFLRIEGDGHFPPGITSFMWQQRSSRSRSVAALSRSRAPQSLHRAGLPLSCGLLTVFSAARWGSA